jgi:uncharacterized protein (TIGR00725 family)
MSEKVIAGVMGPGEDASEEEVRMAAELGGAIARRGWVLLTGGRNAGVMDAASRGARNEGGTVIGVLPGADRSSMSPGVDIAIVTGLREARNSINVLSSHLLFFVGMSPGTASELSLALKYCKPCILIAQKEEVVLAFQSMARHAIEVADTPAAAVEKARKYIGESSKV